jgi:hypothetical protein
MLSVSLDYLSNWSGHEKFASSTYLVVPTAAKYRWIECEIYMSDLSKSGTARGPELD